MADVKTPTDQDIIDINNNISDINTNMADINANLVDYSTKVDNKVNKDGTKVLSDNNYSNSDKSKVDKITTLETDINTRALKSELDKTNSQLEDKANKSDVAKMRVDIDENSAELEENTIDISKVKTDYAKKTEVGSPLIARNVSDMIDVTKVYVNTTDNNWYSYNGTEFVIGGIYNSNGIGDRSITPKKVTEDFADEVNNVFYNCFWDSFDISQSALKNFTIYDNGNSIETVVKNASLHTINSKSNMLKQNANKKISFNFVLTEESRLLNGAMIGVCNSDLSKRFLIGYEPVHNAIEIYNGFFTKLIDIPTSGRYEMCLYINNKESYLFINGVKYVLTTYMIDGLTHDFIRLQLKYPELGLKIEKLKIEYLTQEMFAKETQDIKIDTTSFKKYNNYGTIKGKNVHVYQFGGKGNDWCFVRTPEGYNPQREKPYPFVIANHGNGWNMNGQFKFANWTKRTMYVPINDPDYIENPEQYNGTEDSSLWYTNPTIEELLRGGYIVCGCQNYADVLYGNNDCRNACADFFNHMVKNYNVEENCHMIGASNGAMTTLNTVYLLGNRVKSIILQYPLTCLWEHYNTYPSHQASIRKAYGITNVNITKDDFIKATRTHDVMYTSISSGVKMGYFPPTKIWYSNEDTVTNPVNNSILLLDMLDNSNLINDKIIATGGHGDYTHFNPIEYLSWFEKYN